MKKKHPQTGSVTPKQAGDLLFNVTKLNKNKIKPAKRCPKCYRLLNAMKECPTHGQVDLKYV